MLWELLMGVRVEKTIGVTGDTAIVDAPASWGEWATVTVVRERRCWTGAANVEKLVLHLP